METTELKKGLLAVSEVEPVETLMSGLLARSQEPPKEGDIIEGTVIALDRARLYIDLPPFGTGVIYGREYMNAREVIKRTNVGDIIQAKVIATNTKTVTSSLVSKRRARPYCGPRPRRRSKTNCSSSWSSKRPTRADSSSTGRGSRASSPPRSLRPSTIRASATATRTKSSTNCASWWAPSSPSR